MHAGMGGTHATQGSGRQWWPATRSPASSIGLRDHPPTRRSSGTAGRWSDSALAHARYAFPIEARDAVGQAGIDVLMKLRPGRLALLVLACGAAVASGCGGKTQGAATFDPQRGRAFEQPDVLRSRGGLLRTTFTVDERRFTVAGLQVRG